MLTRGSVHDMDENDLRKQVLIPLLKSMGYQDVFEYHGGAGEQGKDIVCWMPDQLDTRINLAIVAKAVHLSGRASVSRGTAGEIHTQIQQCFGKPFLDPVRGEEQNVHQCWVISNKAISKETVDALKSSLTPDQLERNVRFIDGDRLWDLIEKHLPTAAVLQRFYEAREVFETLDTHYRVKAKTSDSGVELGIEEKFPGASQEKPLTISARFAFPDTEEGHVAQEAFERHRLTGAPVEIPASFAQLAFPEFFQALLGDSTQWKTLRLGPITAPHSMLVSIDILNEDGDTVGLGYVDLKEIQGGQEEVTLTNDHQPIPTRIRLVIDLTSGLVQFTMKAPQYGMNVKQILDGLRLQQSMSKGGVFRITHLDSGLRILEVPFPSGSTDPPDSDFIEAIQDFFDIQMRVGRPINLPDRELSHDEMELLNKLRYILHFGRLRTQWETLNITASAESVCKALPELTGGQVQPINLTSSERIVLFGVELPLGPTQLHALQGMLVNEDEVKTRLEHAAGSDAAIEMQFAPGDDDALLVEYTTWAVQPTEVIEDGSAKRPLSRQN